MTYICKGVTKSLATSDFDDFLDRLVDDSQQHHPLTIVGDFNSWSVDWSIRQTNARGKALYWVFIELDVV